MYAVRNILHTLVIGVGSMAALNAVAFNGEVAVGSGSYSTVRPSGVNDVQSTIYKTSNVTGKMPTNDWWSNLAWDQYSERQYPHPLAVQNQANGLRIYYPGPSITGNSACVCAWMPGQSESGGTQDLTIGHSATSSFGDAKVDGYNDWFVRSAFVNGNYSLKVTYGHGSPFVYAEYANGLPRITFSGTPTIWSGNSSSAVLGVTINNRHYALFGPSGSTWSGIGSNTLTNSLNGKNFFSVALLPDNSSNTLSKFTTYAYSHVTNTAVSWSYNQSTAEVTTTYSYTTTAKQGSQSGTLFALYPHQWKNTSSSLTGSTYASVRGVMKLGEGTSFTTKMKFPGVLPSLPDLGTYNRSTLAGYVGQAKAESYTGPFDTYWYGKRLGKLATLAPIADQVGDSSSATQFRNEMKDVLQNWFKASDSSGALNNDILFYYNSNWGTLFGYPDSYGSVLELNDHHFHYGYFIKAAAEIARVDRTWASTNYWGAMVRLLIRDFASPNRSDSLFPFMRNFDIYAGHTWASGHSRFGDGNNNESSSEAMNAWAGVILFAEAMGDTTLRDMGIYLYTTEMNAINEYWFDVTGQNHHPNFSRATASMIWGGKTVGDGVWWTANPEEVHGINWLPITGASLYLTQYPSYTNQNYQALVSENGGTGWDVWADLIWMYRSIYAPSEAVNWANSSLGSAAIEAGNSRANTYHWIHNLNALGTTDLSVTASTPLYAVFNKGGTRTYVAYNMGSSAITVSFSDGKTLNVAANSFSSGNGNGGSTGDTQAPSTPSSLAVTGKTSSSVSLSWVGSTDNVGVAGYRIYRGGAAVGTTSSTSYTNSGLSASTSYTFAVRAYDAAGNESSSSSSVTVTTDSGSSGGSSGHTISGSNVQFYVNSAPWADVHYIVNGGGQQNIRMTASGSNHSYTLANVASGATVTYRFTIGNSSGGQTETAWTTFTMGGSSGGDTTAPSTPTNFKSTAQSKNSITLGWSASTDNVAVTGYRIYRGGVSVGTSTSTSFVNSGLAAKTSYTFTVRAYDAAGNLSASSSSITVKTK
jgi:endoglucanase Acf2/chitodextrinase